MGKNLNRVFYRIDGEIHYSTDVSSYPADFPKCDFCSLSSKCSRKNSFCSMPLGYNYCFRLFVDINSL